MAQQKKTDTSDAFKALTDMQKEFVVGLASGMNQTEAYRHAFNCENASDATVRVDACRLAKRPNIVLILDSLAEEAQERANISFEGHISELARLSKRAELAGNYGAAVQAEINRGKAAGLYVERTADLTPTDPITTLTELAKISPEAAEALAKQYGYEWTTVDEGSVH